MIRRFEALIEARLMFSVFSRNSGDFNWKLDEHSRHAGAASVGA